LIAVRLVASAIPQIEHDARSLLGDLGNLWLVAAGRQYVGGGEPLIMLRLSHRGRAGQDAVHEDKELAVSGQRGEDTIEEFIQTKPVGIGKVA
jgi:hypothetical protein